jgi:hypothetical protein
MINNNLTHDFAGKWISDEWFSKCKIIDVFKKSGSKEKSIKNMRRDMHILFRKQFKIENHKTTKIYISADDHYKLYINGLFVCEGTAPAYPQRYYYNEVDISKYLTLGDNIIAIDTYYQGVINRVWVSGDNRHGLIFDVVSDGKIVAKSDTTVRCQKHSGYLKSRVIGYGTVFAENYDANSLEQGFEKVDYNDSYWETAFEKTNTDYVLFPQETKQLIYENIKPVTVQDNSGNIILDFGKEYVGYLSLTLKGINGSRVVVRYGEELNENGTVRHKMRCSCICEDSYILPSGWLNIKRYDYLAFRYVEIILPVDCETDLDNCYLVARHYPIEIKSHCKVENADVKKVWNLCANSIKYGVQEVYLDCPMREKGQYFYDSFLVALAHYALNGDSQMFKKLLEDFAISASIDKGLLAVAPCSFRQEIADFSLIYPVALAEYLKLTSDYETVRKLLPIAEGVLSYFKKFERNYLLYNVNTKWNLVGWPKQSRDGYKNKLIIGYTFGSHNVLNAYYIGAIKAVNQLYKVLNCDKIIDVSLYENAYISAFFDSKLGLFRDVRYSSHCSFHSNAIALWFDIGINEKVKENIVALIKNKKLDHCNIFGSAMALFGLYRIGELDLINELVKDKNYWLNMIDEGGTRTFEAFGKDKKWNTALFHLALSFPVIFLSEE